MSYKQLELSKHAKLDTEQKKWSEACSDVPEEQAERLDAIITPKALGNLLKLPQTLNKLLKICDQRLQHTPIFYYIEEKGSFMQIKDKTKRERYAPLFEPIKECIIQNHLIQQSHISGRVPFDFNSYNHLSVMVRNKKFNTRAGYFSVTKHNNPELLGDETIFVFYHVVLKSCCLAIGPSNSEEIRKSLVKLLNGVSILLPFNKLCAFCGRCAEDLVKCSDCKVTRYCNKDCQKDHWDKAHKHVCRLRKQKLDQQEEKIKTIEQEFARKCMISWKSIHSFHGRSEQTSEIHPSCRLETGDTVQALQSELKDDDHSDNKSVSHKVTITNPEPTRLTHDAVKSMIALESKVYVRVQDWPEDGDEESVKSDVESID